MIYTEKLKLRSIISFTIFTIVIFMTLDTPAFILFILLSILSLIDFLLDRKVEIFENKIVYSRGGFNKKEIAISDIKNVEVHINRLTLPKNIHWGLSHFLINKNDRIICITAERNSIVIRMKYFKNDLEKSLLELERNISLE